MKKRFAQFSRIDALALGITEHAIGLKVSETWVGRPDSGIKVWTNRRHRQSGFPQYSVDFQRWIKAYLHGAQARCSCGGVKLSTMSGAIQAVLYGYETTRIQSGKIFGGAWFCITFCSTLRFAIVYYLKVYAFRQHFAHSRIQ